MILVIGVVNLEASRRNDRLLSELRRSFHGMTSTELAPLVGDDTGDGFDTFMRMSPVRPDSVVYRDGLRRFNVRYPVVFFGADRCVFVDFTPDRTSFRQATGDECRRFRG